MKLLTSLRTASAPRAAIFAVGLTLFYFSSTGGQEAGLIGYHGWSPAIVADALRPMYAFSYAVASALAAWESGRLREAAVWHLAPVRSRYRIAANVLLPVLALAWFMLVLSVALRLIQEGASPTLDSMRPLLLGMLLCVAHAVIGFAIGMRVPKLIAAPAVAVMTWVLVAFSVTSTQFWYRHVSGERMDSLAFGEIVPLSSLVPHLLFAGSIAAGVLLLWMPIRYVAIRVCLAATLAFVGMSTAREMVAHWGPHEPFLSGQATMQCAGKAPTVCMPEISAGSLPAVREQVDSVLTEFQAAGVKATPDSVTDALADGRRSVRSTPSTWRVNLTRGVEDGNVRYQVVTTAVGFSCSTPDPKMRREALLWAATITGEDRAYAKQWDNSAEDFDVKAANRNQVHADVKKVLTLSAPKQADWFTRTVLSACERA
ncbi:hypothetical protein AB0D30_41480 [Streptomyces sp. NPDC048409]|uniref:DUF7224 domain-containing protein n=1 Tax=Streptomyces sp. NPDC048409 TaxID=3154723 RepID=UPI00342DFEA5